MWMNQKNGQCYREEFVASCLPVGVERAGPQDKQKRVFAQEAAQ